MGARSRTSLVFLYMAFVHTLPSMAANLLCPTGSPLSPEVPTSFVPPIHNQGVSLAPSQGHTLWTQFLLTAGSFFVCLITDSLPAPAPFGGRYLWHSALFRGCMVRSRHSVVLCCLQVHRRPSDIADHLLWIVVHLFRQHGIEDPDQLAGNCHQ